MAGNLLLKLVIEGTNAGALRALKGVQDGARATGQALSRIDIASGVFGGTRTALGGLEGQLKSLRSLGGSVFAFAGISVGVAGMVQLADAYANMTGRLRVATQYTGDFDSTLAMLKESASATRSSLEATVDLYIKMSPALRGIGLSAKGVVGVITTINQAINLSGASAQAAAAALVQFGQGMGAGALRGDELNSVIEQTPMLAQAIADGLGVPIGALRSMGDAGELTAEKVAAALVKMKDQIEADANRLPKTVSQSLQALRDAVMLYVGETDAATNGTSSLSNVILVLADAFKNGSPPLTAFTELIKILVNGLDGAYRLIKITGMGLAAYVAMANAARRGNFAEASDIYKQMSAGVSDTLAAQLLTQTKVTEAAVDSTKHRALLEEQLKVQMEKLEKAKAYIAGRSAESITATAKANVDAQIADQQRLVDAVRTAWQASIAETDKALQAQEGRLQKAQDYKQRGADSAFAAAIRGLSQEDQVAAKANRLSGMAGDANFEAARARMAAIEGDVKKFDTLSAAAEKRLLAALTLAEDIGDIPAIKELTGELAALQEAGAKLEGKKASDAKATAESQAVLLNELQGKLEALQKTAREIEVQADVAKATAAVEGLKAKIEALPDKTVTMTVNTVYTGSTAPADTSQMTREELIGAIPGRAFGGRLPGWAPHDRADNVIYRGTPGEWVIQRPAVRYYGAGLLAAINAMQLPKFATGGQLGASMISRLRMPSGFSSAPASSGGSGAPAVLDLGALGRIRVRSTRSTASDVEAVIQRAALRYGFKST